MLRASRCRSSASGSRRLDPACAEPPAVRGLDERIVVVARPDRLTGAAADQPEVAAEAGGPVVALQPEIVRPVPGAAELALEVARELDESRLAGEPPGRNLDRAIRRERVSPRLGVTQVERVVVARHQLRDLDDVAGAQHAALRRWGESARNARCVPLRGAG